MDLEESQRISREKKKRRDLYEQNLKITYGKCPIALAVRFYSNKLQTKNGPMKKMLKKLHQIFSKRYLQFQKLYHIVKKENYERDETF